MKKIITCLAAFAAFTAYAQTIYPRVESFTDDATSGISSTKLYTHRVNLGNGTSGTRGPVEGVTFQNGGGSGNHTGDVPGRDTTTTYQWAGFPGSNYNTNDGGNNYVLPSGQVATLLTQFNYSGVNTDNMYLSNLLPGAQYEVSLYFCTWTPNGVRGQSFIFFPDAPQATTPLDFPLGFTGTLPPGWDYNRRVVHRYAADANGQLHIRNTSSGGTSGTLCLWFFTNELLGGDDLLAIESAPANLANMGLPADPPFGNHKEIAAGSNITATAATAWTNAAETATAHLTGWEILEAVGVNGYIHVSGGDATDPCVYVHGAAAGKIIWSFAATNKLEVSAGPNGSVTPSGAFWCGSTDSLVFTAQADPGGYTFTGWYGDTDGVAGLDNPVLNLPGDRPRVVTAKFSFPVQYVAEPKDGGNDNNDGVSWATPKATIAVALKNVNPNNGLVVVSNGTYNVTAASGGAIVIENPVTVRGFTGNPGDVIVQRASDAGEIRVFTLNHPGARLEGVVVQNGYLGNEAANINVLNGTVSNCVVRGGDHNCWGSIINTGGIYINGPDALVTHCVITNNITRIGGGNNWGNHGAGVYIADGRLEHSLVARNEVRAPNTNIHSAGGVRVMGGTVLHCTIAGNTALHFGGLYSEGGAVLNTVIAGNTSTLTSLTDPNAVAVGGNVAWNTLATRFTNCYTDTPAPLANNFNAAAGFLFANPALGDYTPAPGSPLIDKVLVFDYPPGFADLAGNPRVQNNAVDIGCYESAAGVFGATFDSDIRQGVVVWGQTTVRVIFEATPVGTNENDAVAYAWDFGDGNTAAGRVATNHYARGGVYTVTLNATATNTATSGTRSAQSAQPGWVRIAPRVIYADAANTAGADNPFDTDGNAAATLQDALAMALDGCEIIVKRGTYDVSDAAPIAVGMALRIRGETGSTPGEVVLRGAGHMAIPLLSLNHADAWVGGLALENGGAAGGAGLNNLVGAALRIHPGGGTVSNCVIRANRMGDNYGQGVVYLDSAAALLTHTVITNNAGSAATAGNNTIVYANNGRVENCLIAGNDLPNLTGGIVDLRGTSTLRNCTVVDNTGMASDRGVVYAQSANATVEHCVIAGDGEVIGAANTERFTLCTTDDNAFTGDGTCNFGLAGDIFNNHTGCDYRLKLGSPAVNAGPRVTPPVAGIPSVDLDGFPRIFGSRMDNGCYELQHAAGTLLIVR